MTVTPRKPRPAAKSYLSMRAAAKSYLWILVAALVFLFAWPLALATHLTALGIVFVVLFVLSLLTAVVMIARVVSQSNAAVEQAIRDQAELQNQRFNPRQ